MKVEFLTLRFKCDGLILKMYLVTNAGEINCLVRTQGIN